MGTKTDEPKLYFEKVTTMSLMLTPCPGCKGYHIFGFYHQIPKENQQVDRERMVVTITDKCRDCGVKVRQEYKLTTSSPRVDKPTEGET